MTALSIVILFKIIITGLLWAAVPLFVPLHWLRKLGYPDLEPSAVFIRLLGMAYAALLVGYVLAYDDIVRHDHYPAPTVWVGIVSNGGASAVILWNYAHWRAWGRWARLAQWGSLLIAGGIATGLVIYGPCQHGAAW